MANSWLYTPIPLHRYTHSLSWLSMDVSRNRGKAYRHFSTSRILSVLTSNVFKSGRCDDEDRHLRLKGLDLAGQFSARNIVEAAIEHDATYSRKSLKEFKGLLPAVRRQYVELGGFDHKLSR